jgi:hypothetical protein
MLVVPGQEHERHVTGRGPKPYCVAKRMGRSNHRATSPAPSNKLTGVSPQGGYVITQPVASALDTVQCGLLTSYVLIGCTYLVSTNPQALQFHAW